MDSAPLYTAPAHPEQTRRADGDRRQAAKTRWLRVVRNSVIVLVVLFVADRRRRLPDRARHRQEHRRERQIAEQTGRKATIGSRSSSIRTRCRRPSTTSSSTNPTAPPSPCRSTQLFANVSSASLFRRALVFDALRVTRPNGSASCASSRSATASPTSSTSFSRKPKSDSTIHYSLNNIELDDGQHRVRRPRDRRASTSSTTSTIGLPFLSEPAVRRPTITVTPKFAAVVNGSALALDRQGTAVRAGP